MTELVTWCWQGLVVAGAVRLMVPRLPRLSASTRHVIWWTALGLVLALPWLSSDAPFEPAFGRVPGGAAAGPIGIPLTLPPSWVVATVLVLWAGRTLWLVRQIVSSLRAIGTLKRGSTPFDAARERRLPLWRTMRTAGRRCALRISEQAEGACAVGFRRPAILIPRSLAEGLSDEQLDLVIAHERAHLVRYDDWLRLLQCSVGAVLGLHPAVWLIGRQIDLERETACDDHVVAQTGAPRVYADCLTRAATLLLSRRPMSGVLVAAVTGGAPRLHTRISRLLDRHGNRTPRIGRMSLGVAALALAVGGVALGQMPPLVTFVDAQVVQIPDVPRPASILGPILSPTTTAPAEPPTTQPRRPPSPTASGNPGPRIPGPELASPARVGPSDVPPAYSIATNRTTPDVIDARPPAMAMLFALRAELPTPVPLTAIAPFAVPEPAAAMADDGGEWSEVGADMARAGVSIGKVTQDVGVSVGTTTQRMGEAVGRWFARAGGIAGRPSSR